jgi:hypothetical protein
MTRVLSLVIAITATVLAVAGGRAISAQDKYTVKIPNGLAFSEFRGYEDWQAVTVTQTDSLNLIRVLLANPVMLKAYKEGIPANGKPFPNGSKMAKILWTPKKVTSAPWSATNPDTEVDVLKAVEVIEKDYKRFPDSHGWGYGEFSYDAASDTFKPAVEGAKCGASCHELAAKTDYIFDPYAKR